MAGTAMCFFLHYAGNQIPYELAQQRFAEEFEVNRRYFGGERPLFTYEFCQLSLGVMGGAYRYPGYRPLVDAVLPRSFGQKSDSGGDCAELQALSEGVEGTLDWEKTRYWWGNKAVLAIGLRYLTVFELHRFILVATYGAWLLLAAALALMGWRPLLVAAPAVVFGLAFSGIEYFSDVANGIPYLWSVLAAAMLAFLLRSPAVAQWAPLFCFITGMVSAYLWFFDGHTALAIALIGLVAWLGYERLEADGGTRRAAGCVALYVTGFVVCFVLGQVVKGIVKEWASVYQGWDVAINLFTQASYLLDRMKAETLVGMGEGAELRVCPGCGEPDWQKLPIVRDIRGLWLMTPLAMPSDKVLSAFSALALAGAAAAAVRQVRRGRPKLAGGVLWLMALALLVSIHLFLPSDVPFRSSRFAFLLFATCWACLVLTVMQSSRKGSAVLAGCLMGGLLVIVTSIHLAEAAEARRIEQTIANALPVGQSDFDVYLDGGDNRLVYVKDECDDADVRQKFFLHLFPADHADLPEHRRQYDFDNLDFYFGNYGTLNGGRCIARRPLPDYDIAFVRTGQYVHGRGKIWQVRIRFIRQ